MFQLATSLSSKGLRLFCIPHAGGGPSVYRGWREALGSELDVAVVELPGREGRFGEAPYQRIDDVVGDLAQAVISTVRNGQPFAFFGNSLGGLIAFETLHAIRQLTGLEAEHLYVSAVGAPHVSRTMPKISGLSDSDLIREIRNRYDGIPSAVLEDEELMAAMMPILRADASMVESYRPRVRRPLECPITAFSGSRDKMVDVHEVEAWAEQTTSSFTHVLLDEGHIYMQSARSYLTSRIRDSLLGQQRMV